MPGFVDEAVCPGLAKRSQVLFPCRAGEGAFPETQESLYRESGGNQEPMEEHRGPVCELVSHQRDIPKSRPWSGRDRKRKSLEERPAGPPSSPAGLLIMTARSPLACPGLLSLLRGLGYV